VLVLGFGEGVEEALDGGAEAPAFGEVFEGGGVEGFVGEGGVEGGEGPIDGSDSTERSRSSPDSPPEDLGLTCGFALVANLRSRLAV